MDIGAFIQSFAGEPTMSAKSGITGKENIMSRRQPSEDLAANREATSFYHVVRQILGRTETGRGVSDEANETVHEPVNDMDRMILLIEMLGKGDISELQQMAAPEESDANAKGTIADLLALIQAQLDNMESIPNEISGADTRIETNLLTRLDEKMSALETSIAMSAKAISDDTLKDLQKIHSLLKAAMEQDLNQVEQKSIRIETATDVKIPMGQSRGITGIEMASNANSNGMLTGTMPKETASSDMLSGTMPKETVSSDMLTGTMPKETASSDMLSGTMPKETASSDMLSGTMPKETASSDMLSGTMPKETASNGTLSGMMPNDTTIGGKIAAQLHDQMAGMANNGAVDDPAPTIYRAIGLQAQTTPIVIRKDPARTDILESAGSDSSVQLKADISDGKIHRAKSFVQAIMSQHENTQARQDSNQPPTDHNTGRSHTLEWNGLKTEPIKEAPTATVQSQTAPPLQELGERILANDNQLSRNAQQHQAIENEPTKSAASDVFKNDVPANDALKVAVSVDTSINNRTQASVSGHANSTPPSGDTAFQKTVMNQIVEKVAFRSVNDRSEMRIQLKPDALGDVRMRIVSEKNALVVQMIANKLETKEIIESQLHHLKAELDKQGLTVNKIEVMVGSNNDQQDGRGQFSEMFKNNADSSGKRQNSTRQESAHHQQQRDEKENDSPGDGINYFI
jgi:flagellar hook-length control protein FliK